MIAGRAVDLLRGEDRVDHRLVGEIDLGVAGRAELGEVERAAEETLDDAVIVGGREQLEPVDVEELADLVGEALIVLQAIGFVLAAEDADPEHLHVFGLGNCRRSHQSRRQRGRAEQRFLQHGFVSCSLPMARWCDLPRAGGRDWRTFRVSQARQSGFPPPAVPGRTGIRSGRRGRLGERLLQAVDPVDPARGILGQLVRPAVEDHLAGSHPDDA